MLTSTSPSPGSSSKLPRRDRPSPSKARRPSPRPSSTPLPPGTAQPPEEPPSSLSLPEAKLQCTAVTVEAEGDENTRGSILMEGPEEDSVVLARQVDVEASPEEECCCLCSEHLDCPDLSYPAAPLALCGFHFEVLAHCPPLDQLESPPRDSNMTGGLSLSDGDQIAAFKETLSGVADDDDLSERSSESEDALPNRSLWGHIMAFINAAETGGNPLEPTPEPPTFRSARHFIERTVHFAQPRVGSQRAHPLRNPHRPWLWRAVCTAVCVAGVIVLGGADFRMRPLPRSLYERSKLPRIARPGHAFEWVHGQGKERQLLGRCGHCGGMEEKDEQYIEIESCRAGCSGRGGSLLRDTREGADVKVEVLDEEGSWETDSEFGSLCSIASEQVDLGGPS